MTSRDLSRLTLSACLATALLAGCGALRPAQDDMQSPIGAPGAMPQTSTIARTAWSYKLLYAFQLQPHNSGSGDPLGGLLNVDATLYGTTEHGYGGRGKCHENRVSCGTVYSISTTGAYKTVYAFRGGARDGALPGSGLIDVNGTLYGTTESGGSKCNCGTVYSISASGAEKVLYSFAGGSDGANPTQGNLLYMNGTLYGTTYGGGSYKLGTVYSVTTSGGEKVLHSFGYGADGAHPQWGLINLNGTMYGTTLVGGANVCGSVVHRGCGSVYSIGTSGAENVLYSFAGGSDGAVPNGGLIDVKGTLYGTTEVGGTNCPGSNGGCGTVYSITTTGTEKVLYDFRGSSDGLNPTGPLIDIKGELYGTTAGYYCCSLFTVLSRERGDSSGSNGTVFSVTTAGTEKVLYSFTGRSDGSQQPDSPLIDVNGTLCSTTYYGGNGWGTVFALSP